MSCRQHSSAHCVRFAVQFYKNRDCLNSLYFYVKLDNEKREPKVGSRLEERKRQFFQQQDHFAQMLRKKGTLFFIQVKHLWYNEQYE